MTQSTPAAFFSYSRADSEFALRLAEDLKAAGANAWLDQLDIAPGERWARAVQKALNISPRVLVILSPASVNSNHVEDEVNFALDEQKTVIPILYQDCAVPFRLRPLQYVDFRKDYARGLKELIKTLNPDQSTPSISGAPKHHQTDNMGADKGEPAAEGERQRAAEQDEARKAAERARLEEERKRATEQAQLEPQRKQATEQVLLGENSQGFFSRGWRFFSQLPFWLKIVVTWCAIVLPSILYLQRPIWTMLWSWKRR